MKRIDIFINENILNKSGVGLEVKLRNWVEDAFAQDVQDEIKVKQNKIISKGNRIYFKSKEDKPLVRGYINGVMDIPDIIDISGMNFSTVVGIEAPPADNPNYDHIVKRLFNGDFDFKSFRPGGLMKDMIIPCQYVRYESVGLVEPIGDVENVTFIMKNPNPRKSYITFEKSYKNFGMDKLDEITVKGHLENLNLFDTAAGDEITIECRKRLNDPDKLSEYLNKVFAKFEDVRYVQTGSKRDVYMNNNGHWEKV